MKKLLLFISVSLLCFNSLSAQKKGTLDYLDYKKSFKNFVLGDDISNYESYVGLFNKETDDVRTYFVNDKSIQKLGDIPLETILIQTYQNKIAIISVSVKLEHADDLFNTFCSAYGTDYSRKDKRTKRYEWEGEDIYLVYNMAKTKRMAIYIHREIYNKMSSNSSIVNSIDSAVDEL